MKITIIIALIVLIGISTAVAVVALVGFPESPEKICGNGICEFGEDHDSCPSDCTTWCGDGICSPELGETETNCIADCYVEPPPVFCGNGVCDFGETFETCPEDCPGFCGDGICNPDIDETPITCPQDCQAVSEICSETELLNYALSLTGSRGDKNEAFKTLCHNYDGYLDTNICSTPYPVVGKKSGGTLPEPICYASCMTTKTIIRPDGGRSYQRATLWKVEFEGCRADVTDVEFHKTGLGWDLCYNI